MKIGTIWRRAEIGCGRQRASSDRHQQPSVAGSQFGQVGIWLGQEDGEDPDPDEIKPEVDNSHRRETASEQ
jgi:hypothetical protein